MSDEYLRRLARIQNELDVAQDVVIYVQDNWDKKSILDDLQERRKETRLVDVRRLGDQLEVIFIIRLFATFEGILKQHMTQYHPPLPKDVSASFLIDRVGRLQKYKINASIRDRAHEVRRYRNFLVHPGGDAATQVLFPEALAGLSKFVDRLPDPR